MLLVEDLAVPDLLLVDNHSAVGYLRGWQDGDLRRMPAGYSTVPRAGGPPTLVRLATKVNEIGTAMRVEIVAGHTGHILNEAADSLAKIGRTSASAAEAENRAERLVGSFLVSWHASNAGEVLQTS